ncbi:MAG TPA: hypothetical protein PKW55_03635 [Spirochaetota bacterium]|mgnify:CR=1 FL=1|nr:hypothetical protein [Spirochaetota bacterium]HOM38074.1 hypothetical protein [Spirochaetota bacterium]HPQ48877.1 hypothetical protein [Spirochaetota bacterium]
MKLLTKNKLIFYFFVISLNTYAFDISFDIGLGYETWQKNSSYYEINSFISSLNLKIPVRFQRIIFAGIFGYNYSNLIKYPKLGLEFNYLIHPDYMPFLGLRVDLRWYNNIYLEDQKLNTVYTLSFVGGSKVLKLDSSDIWLKIELLLTNSKYSKINGNGFYFNIDYSLNI